MYHAKNCYVKIDNTEMEYVTFGNGTQPFIIIPGLGDALKTVRGTAVPFSYMYRTYAKYFKVYLFSRKNMIPKDYTIADMADDQAKVLKTLGISDACVMGVSQGGMISMHLAAKYPELVTRLVLANTAPYANDVIKTVVGTWIDMAKQGDFKDIFIDTAEKTYSEQKLKTYRRFYGILSKMSEPKSLEMLVWHMMHGPGLERFKYQPLLLAENGIILSEIRQHMRLLRIFLIASLKSMKNMVMVLLKKQKILMI